MPKEFMPVSLPVSSVDKIKRLRIAFSFSSGRIVPYEEIIDILVDSLQKTNPGLYNTFLNVKETSIEKL